MVSMRVPSLAYQIYQKTIRYLNYFFTMAKDFKIYLMEENAGSGTT